MEKVIEQVGREGLFIPREVIEQCGVKEGDTVVLEIHKSWAKISPQQIAEEEVENLALRYLLKNIGDAVGITKPEDKGDRWLVSVLLPYKRKYLGALVFSKYGALMVEESSTPEQILSRLNEV